MLKKIMVYIFLLYFIQNILPADFKFDPSKIKNPTLKNSWIIIYGEYISQAEQEEINALIDNIEKDTSVEIAVVVVPNTGGDIFQAAQALFDKWKIGKKGKDNGLLLLASIDERQFRTHTGYGMEGILPDAACRILQDRTIVPNFRNSEYGKGIIEYIKIINEVLKNPSYLADEEKAKAEQEKQKYEALMKQAEKARFERKLAFFSIAGLIFLTGFILLGYNILYARRKIKDALKSYTSIGNIKIYGLNRISLGWFFLIFFFGALGLLVAFNPEQRFNNLIVIIPVVSFIISIIVSKIIADMGANIVNVWRIKPRNCPECRKSMRKLDENEDDKYLSKGQIVEETLASRDYDVWICESCDTKTIEVFEGKDYSLYTECPKCKLLAGKQVSSKIIVEPTYAAWGNKDVFFKCVDCGHEFKINSIIPMLISYTPSSSSDSSYSSSYSYSGRSSDSSFSSGSSSSSSSSSSSRSYGGGSSGGGGATSSW